MIDDNDNPERDDRDDHGDGAPEGRKRPSEPIEDDMFARDERDDERDGDLFAADEPDSEPEGDLFAEDVADRPDYAEEENDGELILGRDDISADDDDRAEDDAPVAPRRKRAEPARATPQETEERTSVLSFLTKLVGLGFAIGALGVVCVAAGVGWYLSQLEKDLPDYKVLSQYAPPVTTRVYAGDGSLVAEFARERRLFVPIQSIPDYVKYAFISAEDKSFYEHNGLDLRGFTRAQLSNVGNILKGRRLEGGSTITQQVAKNFLLTSEQKIERKMREMLIARKMERAFSKDHILELYLNEIYLGNRSYGVAAAALNYFDKSLDDLTVAEAAYLAALTKGPSNYQPENHEDRAIARRNWVIGRMLEDGRITQEQADEAQTQPLGAHAAPPLGARDWTMEYFAEEVRKEIVDLYGVEALYDGGLAVRTSVDPRLQKIAGKALRKWLVEYDQRHGWRGPIDHMDVAEDWAEPFAEKVSALSDKRVISDDLAPWRPALVLKAEKAAATVGFEDGSTGIVPLEQMAWARDYVSANREGEELASTAEALKSGDIVYVEATGGEDGGTYALEQAPAINGGLIAIDPHTGRVLAMVGGFSFQLSEFNRAIQAERQPGSAFKPFVYSVALDNGYTPSSTVLDAPFVAPGVDSWYKPGNYEEGKFFGPSTLRVGIEHSRNTMTARLAQDLGIGRIMDYVERFKLSNHLPRELAISLGAGETTVMRITAAYSTFVNGGKRVEPSFIDRIQDRTGKTIYKRDTRACAACNVSVWSGQSEPQLPDARAQVMDPRTAFQITSILEGVVVRGTGSAVRRVSHGRPLAGKTGTTNDYKDAWFVGFSPDLAAGVYVGFDMPQTLGHGETGGKVAAPVFADFMVDALKNEPGIPFRVPSGIRLVRVDAKTGKPATPGDRNVILEAFKAGDIIGGKPSNDELYLDPLSAAPARTNEESGDELDGLY